MTDQPDDQDEEHRPEVLAARAYKRSGSHPFVPDPETVAERLNAEADAIEAGDPAALARAARRRRNF